MFNQVTTNQRGKRVAAKIVVKESEAVKLMNVQAIRPSLPATSPQMLLRRRKKPLSIQFHLRPGKEAHYAQIEIARATKQIVREITQLQLRITVYGRRDSGFCLRLPELPLSSLHNTTCPVNNYGSILTVDPKSWNVKRQELTGSSQEVFAFNNELQKIKLKIREIFSLQLGRFLQKTGPEPTTETVKGEYLTGEAPLTERGKIEKRAGSIIDGFDAYYQHLLSQQSTELVLSEMSLEKRRAVRADLVNFLNYEETPDLKAKQVNQAWAKRFSSWLMQDGRMLPCSARLKVGIIRIALSFLVEHEQLDSNPLIGLKLPRGKKKQVVWLNPDHVEALWSLDGNDIKRPRQISMEAANSTLFWFKVIVLTGMDYVDAVRYVQNPKDYNCIGIGGRKIVIRRGKNGSECHIPHTDKLSELLLEPMPRIYSNEQTNQTLTIIGELIGFPHALTTKVGRKTAGAMWLLENYNIHEISRFLGHSSIAMTESHYLKTSGITADRGMQRINQNKISQSPFRKVS